jgi:hypothetical protein
MLWLLPGGNTNPLWLPIEASRFEPKWVGRAGAPIKSDGYQVLLLAYLSFVGHSRQAGCDLRQTRQFD